MQQSSAQTFIEPGPGWGYNHEYGLIHPSQPAATEQAITQNHNPCKRKGGVSTWWKDISFPLGQRRHQQRSTAEDGARADIRDMGFDQLAKKEHNST